MIHKAMEKGIVGLAEDMGAEVGLMLVFLYVCG